MLLDSVGPHARRIDHRVFRLRCLVLSLKIWKNLPRVWTSPQIPVQSLTTQPGSPVETDDEACSITFFDLSQRDTDGRPATIGTTTFTMNDAQRAGLGGQNWKKYPRAMLFARAISAGYREHCPDALGAAPVYVEAHGETEIPQPEPRGGKNEPAALPSSPLDELRDLLNSKPNADEIEAMLCERAGVDDLAELPTDKMEAAIAWLSR
jgi:hypothetical protein